MENIEEYRKLEEQRKGLSYKIGEKIKPVHAILIGILFFVSIKLYDNYEKNKYFLYGAIALIVIYIIFISRSKGEGGVIPRHIAQQIAHSDLLNEIGQGHVFPMGTEINPTGIFKDQALDTSDEKIYRKYHFGFKIKEPNRPEREIIYQMNPYTGDSKGIIDMPMGFTGEEFKDIRWIFPEQVLQPTEKKKD